MAAHKGAGARRACLVLAGLLMGAVAGCAVAAAQAGAPGGAGPPDNSCEVNRVLRPANPPLQGLDVMELKERLVELGYLQGPVDETYDARAVEAVRRFQRDRGLSPDGVVDEEEWQALAEESDLPAASTPAPGGDLHIVIDSSKFTLTLYADGRPYKTYPVAVGRPRESTLTPVGEWRVSHKALNWGGGFGTRWIGINVPWGIYGIHGTNKPYSIGRRASAGCIRMYNRDVEELYRFVSLGTPVTIVGVRPTLAFNRPLRPGASGKDVVEVQLALRAKGFDPGEADGRYGPRTREAVMALQRAYGLPADGEVWEDVYTLLGLR